MLFNQRYQFNKELPATSISKYITNIHKINGVINNQKTCTRVLLLTIINN